AAQKLDVVEDSFDPKGFSLVMVPKVEGYKAVSAAYFEAPGNYELIYKTDAFSGCSASMSSAMADELAKKPTLSVTYPPTEGTFETTEDLGEYGVSHMCYEITAGRFSSSGTLDDKDADKRTIRYGNLVDSDWAILRTAVDRNLKSH
ncbi:MAG: hypothetical protein ACKOWI_04515, partial [Rhodoluna sp.]